MKQFRFKSTFHIDELFDSEFLAVDRIDSILSYILLDESLLEY